MPELSLTLLPDAGAPGEVRRVIRERFGEALQPQQLQDLLLVATELTSNAVVHGQGGVALRLQLDHGAVRGEVIDHGGGFERKVRAVGADEIGGRGLSIVEALASRWGIHEGTTHVWFEMEPTSSDEPVEPRLGAEERPDELDGRR